LAVNVGPTLLAPSSWDLVRATDAGFLLPDTRREWVEKAAIPPLPERAAAIADVIRRHGWRHVCSHGVGPGYVEHHLARLLPDVRVSCYDNAPVATARLAALFPEAEVRVGDFRRELPVADVHLFHRVDTELDDREWRTVFDRISVPVVFVAGGLLDGPVGWRSRARSRVGRAWRRDLAFVGYARDEEAMRSLWRGRQAQGFQAAELSGWVIFPAL